MKLSFKIAVVAIALSTAASAFAAPPITTGYSSASSVMPVTASVNGACTVTADPLAFGTYSNSGNSASAAISVKCTNGISGPATAAFNIAAAGLTMTGTNNNADTLAFTLATAATGGTTLSSSVNTIGLSQTGSTFSGTVYGAIAGGQTPAVDTYSASVTVSVSY